MKIYLLNPPYLPHFGREMRWQDTGRGGTLYYPIWLSYATGLLESKGHDVKLIDAPACGWETSNVLEDLEKFKPDMIVVETSFTSLDNDLKVSNNIKKRFGAPIIMVGPPCSQFADKMLDSGADIVVRYEYEFTLLDLAEKLMNGKNISSVTGISFKQDGQTTHNQDRAWTTTEQLSSIPFVSEVYKKHLNIRDYFLNYSLYPVVQLFTGRGCPFNCTFCSWPQSFTGRKYRVRSIESVLDELQWIQKNLPKVKEVFFEDDTFTIDKKRVREFCDSYNQKRLNISWSCNARVDTLDLETMRKMKEANCRFLIVGFESANNEILRSIKKGVTVEEAREFAKNTKKSKLFLHADFIIGLPGETRETIKQTRLFIQETKPELLQISVASPFPGTEFYEWARSNGYLITDNPNQYLDEQGHQKSIIAYPQLSVQEIVKIVDKMLKSYYLSPSYLPRALRQLSGRRSLAEIQRIWRSVKVFLPYIFRGL